MQNPNLLQRIARKSSSNAGIADEILSNPDKIPTILEGLTSSNPRIKFGCSKVLRLASEKQPEALYPQMDYFVVLLDNENTFLRLDAARVLANLARVDTQGKFEGIFGKYFSPIAGPTMIPAANVIGMAPTIVRAKPGLTGRVVAEILRVQNAKYATRECRNIALGHAIKSFDAIFERIEDKAPVVDLVKKQLRNTRPATRKKAELFLRKYRL
jgi:hypothetical protein